MKRTRRRPRCGSGEAGIRNGAERGAQTRPPGTLQLLCLRPVGLAMLGSVSFPQLRQNRTVLSADRYM
jgi:hypothetical protein